MTLKDEMDAAFDEIYGEFNESVTLRTIEEAWDEHDDFDPNTTDTTINAIVVLMTEEDTQEVGGEFSSGDAWMYVKPGVEVEKGDKVKYDGNWYKVQERNRETVKGNEIMIECRLMRIDNQ